MATDFMKQELLNLYYCYRESYKELLSKIKPEISTVEYGKGGEVLHRGYYCPSPVIDIVIGGANRGALLKRPRKGYIYDYSFFKDASGRIIMVDKYVSFSEENSKKVLYNREFLIYHDDEVIAPIYEFSRIDGIKIASISSCKYDKVGKIEAYRIMHARTHQTENGDLFTDEKNCEIYAETYSYDNYGMLEKSTLANQFLSFITEDSFRFYYDSDGFLTSYETENTVYGAKVHDVPKSQRRRV